MCSTRGRLAYRIVVWINYPYRVIRFNMAGGNYRLIAAFDFHRQIVFVKFIGTHAEYDAIDALTVARF
jgi:hypothetical protein